MRRSMVQFRYLLIAACALFGMAACGATPATPATPEASADEPSDGSGFLVAADLQSVTPPHFTVSAAPVNAQLALRGNGCVTVTIAGKQHLPIWPNGTRVTDSTTNPGHYTVSLSTGTTFEVTATTGSAFAASGIVDNVPGPFNDGQGLPGKVQQLLDFCGAPGAPVLFADAATFTKK